MNDLHLVPAGVIHSSVKSPKEMPSLGVDGEIEIFPSYAEALEGIDWHSHLFVIGWMHRADRTVKKAVPMTHYSSSKLITVNLQIKYVNY